MSSENVLCRQGDVWLVGSAADGRSTYVRDSVGLHALARLVAEPGREFHAVDLAGGGRQNDSGEAMAPLDEKAKRAYRQRLAELRSEIDDATHQGETTRVGHLQGELDFLTAEIARGVGLGGRDRPIGSGAERARVRVTRALRAAIKRIGAELPSLGSHLDRTVRTGTYCVYALDPAMTALWRFDADGAAPPVAGEGARSVEPGHGVHVPRAATRFVGRESDLADLERDLTHHQLLTLVGPAGAGKTRLATETGRRLAREFPDGVWFCELASVTHGDSVPHAVAAALDVRPQEGFSVLDSIAMTLAGRHMLLIFDNCEHVLEAIATVVVRLLESCESITVLATSREPLGVAGQRVRPVAMTGGRDRRIATLL
jgi:AAA domain